MNIDILTSDQVAQLSHLISDAKNIISFLKEETDDGLNLWDVVFESGVAVWQERLVRHKLLELHFVEYEHTIQLTEEIIL